jgi:hypothetical protein
LSMLMEDDTKIAKTAFLRQRLVAQLKGREVLLSLLGLASFSIPEVNNAALGDIEHHPPVCSPSAESPQRPLQLGSANRRSCSDRFEWPDSNVISEEAHVAAVAATFHDVIDEDEKKSRAEDAALRHTSSYCTGRGGDTASTDLDAAVSEK